MPAAAIYLVAFVLLDWISYIEPFGRFGITPWNPTEGVSLAFGLLASRAVLPLLALAPLLAEICVRQMPAPLPVLVATSLALGTVYAAAVLLLKRDTSRFDPELPHLRDVLVLIGTGVGCAALASCLYVGILGYAGLIAAPDLPAAILRYWIGDAIGIMVTAPLILALRSAKRPPALGWEAAAQLALVTLALAPVIAFRGEPRPELFYLLFIPIVWMALRGGLLTVSLGLAATQILLVLSVQWLAAGRVDLISAQAMMLVLTLTGLAIGIVVDERRRAETRIRLLQDAQAQLTRLGSFNELSAALAHEINQPLTAATTYARVAAESLQQAPAVNAAAREAAQKAVRQVQRASEVVQRMRQLARAGRSEAVPVAVSTLVKEAIELAAIDRHASGLVIEVHVSPPGLKVLTDPLQTQQVLINLLRNSAEALAEWSDGRRRIGIAAASCGGGMVELAVEDTGPGFRPEILARPCEPFVTTKVDGLGIGLSLCRTIVHANGGRLSIGNTGNGASVRFTLPETSGADDEEADLR